MKGVFVANKAAALLHFTGNYHCLEDRDHNASLQSAVKNKERKKKKTEATEGKRTDQALKEYHYWPICFKTQNG